MSSRTSGVNGTSSASPKLPAIETDLFRIYPPLKAKKNEEDASSDSNSVLKASYPASSSSDKNQSKQDTSDDISAAEPIMSDDPYVAAIQLRYPENYVISMKNHMSLRGVKNTTIMTTPEEMEKLFQSIISLGEADDESDDDDKKLSSSALHNVINSEELLGAGMVTEIDVTPYKAISIDKYIYSKDKEDAYVKSTRTANNFLVMGQDEKFKLNFGSATDIKKLDLRQSAIRRTLRFYEKEFNKLLKRVSKLEEELVEVEYRVYANEKKIEYLASLHDIGDIDSEAGVPPFKS